MEPTAENAFEVVAGDVVIGTSALEHQDAPMGVAFGRLYPTEAYLSADLSGPLQVRPRGREFFPTAFPVGVIDYSAELGPEAIEIHVVGIRADIYCRWFSAEETS